MDPLPASPMPDAPGARPAAAKSPAAGINRLVALGLLIPTLGVLLVAAGLTPAGEGLGTHTQLGLQPCGFEAASGFPCATCGMTTSFSLAADGRLFAAFVVQPAGAILAMLTAMAVLLAGWTLWSGMSLVGLGRALWRPRVVILGIGVVLVGWAYTAGRTAWGL